MLERIAIGVFPCTGISVLNLDDFFIGDEHEAISRGVVGQLILIFPTNAKVIVAVVGEYRVQLIALERRRPHLHPHLVLWHDVNAGQGGYLLPYLTPKPAGIIAIPVLAHLLLREPCPHLTLVLEFELVVL